MENNTLENYKKAVRDKYEKEKTGVNSSFLITPSQANLRDLCWEIFKANEDKDDLNVFSSFFGFQFDLTKRKHFNTHTDRFKPIGTFLIGKTDTSKFEAINLAAILVDLQPRPFLKFKVKGGIKEGMQNKILDEKKRVITKEIQDLNIDAEIVKKSSSFKSKLIKKLPKNLKQTIMAVVIVLCLGFFISYLSFPKKRCMTWVSDHYEEVECSSETYMDNYDARYFDLKKIKACDTTTFFKNDKAIVWYAKSGDSIEYFNQFAPYPEKTSKYLKPITNYIIKKYVNRKSCD
jgi:hypothetical protein